MSLDMVIDDWIYRSSFGTRPIAVVVVVVVNDVKIKEKKRMITPFVAQWIIIIKQIGLHRIVDCCQMKR